MLSKVLAGITMAALPGFLLGVAIAGGAIPAGEFGEFALIAATCALVAAILGGVPAIVILATLLRRANPWKVWPAGVLGACAGALVTMEFQTYFGMFSFAISALGGGLATAIVLRIWLATPYGRVLE